MAEPKTETIETFMDNDGKVAPSSLTVNIPESRR